MIIGFLSGGFIGLVAGIFFMSMCQAASGAEELTKKWPRRALSVSKLFISAA